MAIMHVVLLGALAAVAGGQAPLSRPDVQQPSDKGHPLVPPGKDPYKRLFNSLQEERAKQMLVKGTAVKPRVVCGMVVVTANPAADPKMIVRPKEDSKLEYKARIISPRLCNE